MIRMKSFTHGLNLKEKQKKRLTENVFSIKM